MLMVVFVVYVLHLELLLLSWWCVLSRAVYLLLVEHSLCGDKGEKESAGQLGWGGWTRVSRWVDRWAESEGGVNTLEPPSPPPNVANQTTNTIFKYPMQKGQTPIHQPNCTFLIPWWPSDGSSPTYPFPLVTPLSLHLVEEESVIPQKS